MGIANLIGEEIADARSNLTDRQIFLEEQRRNGCWSIVCLRFEGSLKPTTRQVMHDDPLSSDRLVQISCRPAATSSVAPAIKLFRKVDHELLKQLFLYNFLPFELN